jgi:hypothetical protein
MATFQRQLAEQAATKRRGSTPRAVKTRRLYPVYAVNGHR